MQLGFASAILPDLNFEQVFTLAAEIGYRCVEVMCWPPSKAERRYAGITHIDLTASVEHLKRVIESAPKLGLMRVNTFIGRDHTKSVDDNWPRVISTWKPIVELAEKHSVKIGIENCPMFFTNDEWPGGKNIASSPRNWRRLFSDLGSESLGLNYDPSHMIFQQMDYLKPIREFADRIFHVHAKDVRVDRHRLNEVGILANPNEYHTPKLPCLGEVDWGAFLSTLADVKYTGPVCVEVEDRSYEGSLEGRKEALRQSFRYLSQLMPVTLER